MEPTSGVRVDRWLWAVRLYKTRTQAGAACTAGHVQVNGQICKPARLIRPGDEVVCLISELRRTVKVLDVLVTRIGARLVPRYLQDLTPPAEYEKARQKRIQPEGYRPKGTGRPTKKDRRQLKLGGFFGLKD